MSYAGNNFTFQSSVITNRKLKSVLANRFPYRISSLLLSIYIFSTIVGSQSTKFFLLSNAIGILTAASFAADFVIAHQRRLIIPFELVSLFLFLFVMVASGLWVVDFSTWAARTSTVFQLLILVIIATNILIFLNSITPVTVGFVAGLLLASFYTIRANDFNLFVTNINPNIDRSGGLLVNANLYALILLIGILICGYSLINNSQSRSTQLILGIVIIIFAHQIMFISGSRKGLLSLVMISPVYLFFRYFLAGRLTSFRLPLVAFSMIALYFASIWILQQSPYYSRLDRIESDFSEGHRADMIDFGIEKWKEKPLLGHGVNQYRVLYYRSKYVDTYAHNNYIELLVNNGLIGLFFFYSFHINVARNTWHKYRNGLLTEHQAAWVFCCISMLIFIAFVDVTYFKKEVWLLYAVLLSILNFNQPNIHNE